MKRRSMRKDLDLASHMEAHDFEALRRGRADTLGRVRWSLHLSRCPQCLEKAVRLPAGRDGEVLADPVACALLHLGQSETSWLDFERPLRDALRWARERPLGFAFLLVEEATRSALVLRRSELFALPTAIAEIMTEWRLGVESQFVLARSYLRRARVEAFLGEGAAASESLHRAATTSAGLHLHDELDEVKALLATGRRGAPAGGSSLAAN